MVQGIEHAAIVSYDTAALKDWYLKMFGGQIVYDNGKGTYFLAFPNGDMIEFVTAQEDKPSDVERSAGIRHLALAVDSESFDELVPLLKADERVEEVHDVSENDKGLKTYWFKDIEGNFLHLIYRPEPLV
ncbi:MAG: VOC family protein [Clostridia bacterium]|nr:VOC family protein [Clostridia bacterium]